MLRILWKWESSTKPKWKLKLRWHSILSSPSDVIERVLKVTMQLFLKDVSRSLNPCAKLGHLKSRGATTLFPKAAVRCSVTRSAGPSSPVSGRTDSPLYEFGY